MAQILNKEIISPTGQKLYVSGATPQDVNTAITAASLAPTPTYTPPTPTKDTTNYDTSIADGTARIDTFLKEKDTDTSSGNDLQSMMRDVLGSYKSDPSLQTGVAEAEQADLLSARRARRAAQAELASTQAQVQAVIDRRNAENLRLEQTINQGATGVGGAGSLASSSFLNVRQQEVNRQAAIEALPLQAKALAAQAKVQSMMGEEEFAQSTYKVAQDKLDAAFKYQYDSEKSKVELWNKSLDKVWTYLDTKEKARATEMKDQVSRNQADLKDVRDAAQTAFQASDQKDLYAQFIQIPIPDVTSKTFAQDLQEYQNKVASLQRQIKPKDLAGGGGGVVPQAPPIVDNSGNVLEYGTPEYVVARLKQTSGSKTKPVASEREQLGKFANVVALTDNLMGSLSKTTNDPILGYLRSLNPYDFDARAVNAQVIALVPSVARALYGEVGVLTDTDIERYLKTLPNLKSTADQNKFIAAMTLANAKRSYEQTLLNLANSNVNVSGFADSYKALTDKLTKLEKSLGADALADIPSEKVDAFDSVVSQPKEGGYLSNLWNAFIGK